MNSKSLYTPEHFFGELKDRFQALLEEKGLLLEKVNLSTKALTSEEAIGITKRKDFPIITGKDIMVQAECAGSLGQAFTDAPVVFKGTLKEICDFDIVNHPHNRGIFIAALNAVMKHLGLSECTVHCRNDGPEQCAVDALNWVRERYGNPKIGLIGYQPSLLECLSKEFSLRIADLNTDNIGKTRYDVFIEDGGDPSVRESICEWADLVLCTGSTICNGTIVNFLPLEGKVFFYGTTLAGAATLMNLPRLCFADRYQPEQSKGKQV